MSWVLRHKGAALATFRTYREVVDAVPDLGCYCNPAPGEAVTILGPDGVEFDAVDAFIERSRRELAEHEQQSNEVRDG